MIRIKKTALVSFLVLQAAGMRCAEKSFENFLNHLKKIPRPPVIFGESQLPGADCGCCLTIV